MFRIGRKKHIPYKRRRYKEILYKAKKRSVLLTKALMLWVDYLYKHSNRNTRILLKDKKAIKLYIIHLARKGMKIDV